MSTPLGFDAVLSASPPDLDEPAVLDIAARTFGVDAATARDLGSERDRTYLLQAADGGALAVMKLSNAAEDPATLDMEALAVLHAADVDPGLPLALPWRVPGATAAADASGDRDPAAFRATVEHGSDVHHVRMYDVLPGRQRTDPRELDDAALGAWGSTTARLGLALRGFFHPAAQRTMLWDIQHAARTRSMVPAIRSAEHRALVERVLDRFDAVVAPAWPSFRAQVVHTDLTSDNALVDERGRITGIVDFGDASHSALIVDLAGVLDSLLADRHGDELFRAARLIVDGYERHVALEPLERRLLGELLATRAAVTITISSWRSDRGLEDAAFAERYNDQVARTIEELLGLGWDEVARRFGADVDMAPAVRAGLAARRAAVMGPALEPLSYETPIHLEEAHGVWMTDVDGRRYLDAYNNVPVVGHGHPRVVEAIARQARRLNTNLRYPTTTRSSWRSGWWPRCRQDPGSTPSSSSTPGRRPMISPGGWQGRRPAGAAACAPSTPTTASRRRSRPSPRSHGRAVRRPPTSLAGHPPTPTACARPWPTWRDGTCRPPRSSSMAS
jgi:Ser/Thr protein kinase RdoA (MazF antagonist)